MVVGGTGGWVFRCYSGGVAGVDGAVLALGLDDSSRLRYRVLFSNHQSDSLAVGVAYRVDNVESNVEGSRSQRHPGEESGAI